MYAELYPIGSTPQYCEAYREPRETSCRSESDFFYRLKKALRHAGYDVIKKEMVKDGHLTSEGRYYIRHRTFKYAVLDSQYMLREIHKEYNSDSKVKLDVVLLKEG